MYEVFGGAMSVGALIAFQMLAGRASSPLVRLASPIAGGVTFEQVHFSYDPGGNPPVLSDINLHVEPISCIGTKLEAMKAQSSRIKFEAFPFQRHGTLAGWVKRISEDAFQQETAAGTAVICRAVVSLEADRLDAVPEDFRLIPGMTLTAEIKVGERRVISYFLYPILRHLGESLREPWLALSSDSGKWCLSTRLAGIVLRHGHRIIGERGCMMEFLAGERKRLGKRFSSTGAVRMRSDGEFE